MEQVKLWVTNNDGVASPLPRRDRVDYEQSYEKMLIETPEMCEVNFALSPTEEKKIQLFDRYMGVFVNADAIGHVNLVIRPHGFLACPEELSQLLQTVEDAGLNVTRFPQYDEAYISTDHAQLKQVESEVASFAQAGIATWRRNYDE